MFRCAFFLTFCFYLTFADFFGSHQRGQYASGTTPYEFLNPFKYQNTFREVSGNIDKLELVFAWKSITYNLGNISVIESQGPGNDSSLYIEHGNIPFGLERWGNKLFITIPRRSYGVTATCNYLLLPEDTRTKSPGLRPYPDLRTNTYYGRTGLEGDYPLVSVYRPRVDKICNRLWLIDNGLVDVKGSARQVQRPAICIYDLLTDKLEHRFELPDNVIQYGVTSGFVSLTVDVDASDCRRAFAYIVDISIVGLLIYDLWEDKCYRMIDNRFFQDPFRGDFNLNGFQYQWRGGLVSVALRSGLINGRNATHALFHPMASYNEFAVSTSVLKNQTLATRSFHYDDIKYLGWRGPDSQSAIHDIHGPTGVAFFAQIANNSVACWNTNKPLEPRNVDIIAKDDELLYYVTDLRWYDDQLYFMSNGYPRYTYGQTDPNKVNYRVFTVPIDIAIKGTCCE